ncbi:MAG: GFA family protein [Rhodobacteraceae bacterium]|nr:GFA family protein [Paracoccaceae bacterium]
MQQRTEHTGHCLCGATSYAYHGKERFMAHCHCESCRRATASPFTSFVGVANGQWHWTGKAPQEYSSSPGVTRLFCGNCGTQMAYLAEEYPDEIHFYAATLSDQSHFKATCHVHSDEMVPWVTLGDSLPRK